MMDIESFREYCLSLPGTTEGMKWEHLCFMIEEKIFVIVDLETHGFCIKCTVDEFEELAARDGIKQAPHFARKQWVFVDDLAVLNGNELKQRVQRSRELVLSKLAKRVQAKYI
ncbi:MmcQ/YjbR family DNA-binding protein [Pedobacter sp. ASV28]|uniref:MmcQ/YjbR family DNA-binding protein n=1 Tax=Pedobacter sp. ASV28 TaxID=2795123 RepID=UPI0018EADAC4|nr:MmcQ/YjbR family DNA-binding protein [Pedobacter sp. ASV28]